MVNVDIATDLVDVPLDCPLLLGEDGSCLG